MRYGVKIESATKTFYGIIDEYSEEAKKAKKKGLLLVNDLITPERYLFHEDKVVDADFKELDKVQDEAYKKAREISDSLEGVKVGAMFSIGVADGMASYVVTKVNKKTCTVEWRGFGGDRYVDHHFGWGGNFPIKEIERYVNLNKKLSQIFKK